MGIVSGLNPDAISITKNSSYTIDISTQYNPKIYTGLQVSLCFFDSSGTATAFAAGTRILMMDFTDANNPGYYLYVVPDSSNPIDTIRLDERFTELGSSNLYERSDTGEGTILERLVFLVDYVETENSAESGKIALVYDDAESEPEKVIKPVKKIVNIGADATQLTAAVVCDGCLTNSGSFTMNLTVKSSTPTVNTAYEDDIYAIKLSVDGGFPDGSYAEIDGIRYYSNNGCITVSPLASGGFMSELYSPLPITSVGGRSAFRVELLPGVSSSSNPTAKSVTAEFDCIDTTVCALDADLSEKVFEAGWITDAAITLRYEKVEAVTLTISRKNADGSYTEVMRNIVVDLPNDNSPFSIVLGNGFQASSGETYMFSFVGYVKDTPVCRDDCCIAIGY